MEIFVLGLLAYVATGLALTGYDFSAPLIHRKGYVAARNYKVAVVTWFIWPFSAFQDIYYAFIEKKAWFRFAVGVIVLLVAMFFLATVVKAYVGGAVGYVVAFIALVFASPVLVAIALPRHDKL